MARGSALLAAPDGDLAYWGRSQEQSWALALTAAGAGVLGPGRAERLRGRTARRIEREHGFGPFGVWIVPALRTDPAAGRAAMDDYAANGVYNGLTLVGAEWTLAGLPGGERRVPAPTAPLGADADGAWRVGRGAAGFAVARHGDVWFAVRMRAGTGGHRGDPRYAFGLMAAKRRSGGRWRDLVPAAPRALSSGDGPGPSLVLRDGTVAHAYGRRIVVGRRRGTVTVVGGFRTAAGRVVRHAVRFAYAPTRTGVSVSFPVRARDVVDVADFRAGSVRPVAVQLGTPGRRARDLRSVPTVLGGYASATRGDVERIGARVRVTRRGTLTWLPRG
jgi:hypothetical protein